jgi:putative glycosyltransferase (TIGR04348 family)
MRGVYSRASRNAAASAAADRGASASSTEPASSIRAMTRSGVPTLILVTPYGAAANNGNWRTAARWARLLAPRWRVILQRADDPVSGGRRDGATALIALHARRSRAAIAAWRAERPDRALIVALTGTDLYRDLATGNADVRASLSDADRLIVLQDQAPLAVPATHRAKVDVVFQSARHLVPWPAKRADRLHCLLVAHLRPEKDPLTAFASWRRLPRDLPITLTIIGDALDPALARAARELAMADSRVEWLGPRPHAWTRQAIKRAHLLLCPSRMEGGANVVVEALTGGTPVLASRISGNVGMLGSDYPGYFPVGDADALAALLRRALAEPEFSAELAARCAARVQRFDPADERVALERAVATALAAAAARAGRMNAVPRRRPRRTPA